MATLVLTALGDDRPGLVAAISSAINARGGSWEQSHFSELAGKFAGIVVLSAPDAQTEAIAADLLALEDAGLHVQVERTDAPVDEDAVTFELVQHRWPAGHRERDRFTGASNLRTIAAGPVDIGCREAQSLRP